MARLPIPHDPALPAAVHLAGPDAYDLLAAAVTYGDGELHDARPCHVQYRPGSDAVVRYDAHVSWAGAAPVKETLVAATHRSGALPGTVPLTASHRGVDLEVGVWRWPFDPLLPALAEMVTPTGCARLLDGIVDGPVTLDVVAYRPTERAVVRVCDAADRVVYVKVLPPAAVSALVSRHDALRAVSVPVPAVVAADPSTGWLAMEELRGDTVRLRLKGAPGPWPSADQYVAMLRQLRSAAVGDRVVPTRTGDASGHAAMLAMVAPDLAPRLERIVSALEHEVSAATERRASVHGDVHEAQLVLDDDRIVGLLDIDDAGIGDPLDDMATMLGHLHFRQLTTGEEQSATDLGVYIDELTVAFADECEHLGQPSDSLHRVTAAVLVGLATGPFRVQQADWQTATAQVVERAESLVIFDERSLSTTSSPRHDGMREMTITRTTRPHPHHTTGA